MGWLQSPLGARSHFTSKIDFWVTIIIPFFALNTFVVQRLLEVQIINYISQFSHLHLGIANLGMLCLLFPILYKKRLQKLSKRFKQKYTIGLTIIIISAIGTPVYVIPKIGLVDTLVSLYFGLNVGIVLSLLLFLMDFKKVWVKRVASVFLLIIYILYFYLTIKTPTFPK